MNLVIALPAMPVVTTEGALATVILEGILASSVAAVRAFSDWTFSITTHFVPGVSH